MEDHIIKLFCDFDSKNEFASGCNGPRLTWTLNSSEFSINENLSLDFPYKKDLSIDNSIEQIDEIYQKYGVIQMRKYKNEETLVLGCGNDPIFFESYECAYRKEYHDPMNKDKYFLKERIKHLHPDCYTVNPDIGMNPSIVGSFGINKMDFLPQNSFKKIIFEGFMIDCYVESHKLLTKNVCTIESIIYLLQDNGVVYLLTNDKKVLSECCRFYKKNQKLYSMDNQIVIESDNDYLQFYSVMQED